MREARSKSKPSAADTKAAVDAFMATLEHPHRDAVAELRRVVAGADPSIGEGVKWNAPSFRTTEYFATVHLRAKIGIGLILHLGAKARNIPDMAIDDPEGIVTWVAMDRAVVSLADLAEVRARKATLRRIVSQWIRYV
jgi:hypothetical protein